MTLPSASVDLASERTCEAPSSRSTWRPSTSSCARAARAAALTTGIALLAGLGACGGKADANPTGIQQSDIDRIAAAASHQASASASAGMSSPASASTSPADYTVPEAAKAHTKEGAKAFVKFYWGALDALSRDPQVGVLPKYGTAQCVACEKQERVVADLVAQKQTIRGVRVALSNLQVHEPSTTDVVIVTFLQDDTAGMRAGGASASKPMPANHLNGAARVRWADGAWKLDEFGADAR